MPIQNVIYITGKKSFITVLVINASGYDNHLILAKVAEKFKM